MNTRLIGQLAATLALGYAPLCTAQDAHACLVTGSNLTACAKSWEAAFTTKSLPSSGPAYEAGQFDGFVSGVGLAEVKRGWCPPQGQGFSEEQLSAITSKYLREHPERWSLEPVVLVRLALAAAFPCSPKQP